MRGKGDQKTRDEVCRESFDRAHWSDLFGQRFCDAPPGLQAPENHGQRYQDKQECGVAPERQCRHHAERRNLGGIVQASRKARQAA